MNRLKLAGRYYPAATGEVWRGDYATALKLRWNLAATGAAAYAIVKECPNHQGDFDCTPFCELCGGEQELKEQE